MKYQNLDLEAFEYTCNADQVERFRVHVAGQQRLEEAETVTLPAELRGWLRLLDARKLALAEMITLGEALAAALFPPGVRGLVERHRARLPDDTGLRIRLRLDTYALADLPWEYAYLPQPGTPPGYKGQDGFLVLDRSVSLVRYEVLGQAPGSLDPVTAGPLRLVALMASPQAPGYRPLNLAAEAAGITQAVNGVAGLRAEIYQNATLDKLEDALIKEAHIFHFAGHGLFSADIAGNAGKGFLIFEDETGGVQPLPAERLAMKLKGRGVRLAVLGACEGGRRDNVNPWTGIVPALTRAGIPAVLGMQYTIGDPNAIAFSKRFYKALVAGQPIDAAVSDGRQAIVLRGSDDERDWGVPVLYLRAEEGVLFPQAETGSSPLAGTGNGGSPLSGTGGGPTFYGTGNGGLPLSGTGSGGPAQASTGTGGTTKPRRPPLQPDPENVDKRILREAMIEAFNTEELEAVCLEIQESLESHDIHLPVNLEMVGGSSKSAQVLNLIQYLDRRGYLGYLVAAVRRERSGLI